MYPAPARRRSSGHSSATNVPPIAHSPPMPIPASKRNTASCQTLVTSALRKVNSEYQTIVSMSVRTLMLTIVWYSVFTFLSALVTSVWQLAVLRLLAGIGIGGEWAMGGTFVAEEWPEDRRRAGAGYMHTGYYVGIFLAALLNYWIGSRYGWRTMFFVGGLPALLLAWVRHGVTEPQRWRQKEGVVRSWQIWKPLAILFSSGMRRRTILNSLYMLASICGLWAGTVYVPAAVTVLAEAAGRVGAHATQLASSATMLVSLATILGCLAMPWIAEKLGRRGALGFFLAMMLAFMS